MAEETKETRNLEEFLATARKRLEQDADDERILREQAKLDLDFEAGKQWDEAVAQQRRADGRYMLTFPRCHTFVQQVANEARQNKPQIKFVPSEDNDKDTAEVYEGLARHIQYSSSAQVAYETALEYAAAGGFGYYRFLTDYVDDKSNDLEIKVVPVYDPMSVYGVLIPACFGTEPDHAFVVEDVPFEAFKAEYPNAKGVSLSVDDYGREAKGWRSEKTVRVAEYWTVDTRREQKKIAGRDRWVTTSTVKYCEINGVEILEGSETEWVGDRIDIFAVLGKLRIIDGKPELFSVIRFQRDPQRLINFYKTRIAETLATAPIQPYMVPQGAIPEGQEGKWAKMNTSLAPYLQYKPYDGNGQPIPAPARQVFEAPIASLTAAAMQEIDDMKATTGIYDASLGAKSNESSGVAIARRQQQSDVVNAHFMDNLERSFKESGEELAKIIPLVYDTPGRIIRILGADEAPKLVKINADIQQQDGTTKRFTIGGPNVAKMDVVVSMGRAFSTKRMESFDMMGQLIQAAPDTFPQWADIYFKNSDLAGADQIAERFKKMLPPNLLEQDGNDPAAQAQQAMAKAEQMGQQLQAMNSYLQQKEQEFAQVKQQLDGKVLDIESRERLAQMQEETKRIIETARLELEAKKLEFEREKLLRGHAHDIAKQNDQQAFDAEMAEKNRIAAEQQAERDRTQEAADEAGDGQL